jgi:opacity protein-like surface antigen
MVSVKSFLAAAATAAISTAGYAADMPLPPPPQIQYQPIQVIEATGRWYLRGDVGVGVQSFSEFDHTQTNAGYVWPPSWQIVQQEIQDTSIFGVGVGYEMNNWLRFDVTGEYRTKAAFKVTGSYTDFCPAGPTCFDVNTGNFSSAVFLANAYVDLGTWWCLTPFIGVGVGGARNTISGVQDNGIVNVGFGYTSGDNSMWNLAWDVQAGVTYNVNNNLKIDLSWRYLNVGSPQSAVVNCQNTSTCPGAFYTFKDMASQDFRIGLRWMLTPEQGMGVMSSMAQPVFAPQQPQYMPAPPPQYMPAPPPQYMPAPPPQYMPVQPPLSSRG